MKESKLVNGYKAIERLYANKLPMQDAFRIYNLKSTIKEIYNFQMEQELKIIAENHGERKENGDLSFPTELDFARFRDAILELNEVELDVQVEPVVLRMDHIQNIEISPADIEALEGFVFFE